MKLRSIELTNVRRFAGRQAVLSGIGDGITVLSEPNEFGKSTFFDSLHAVFFERHGSRNAAIKSLQPHAGGAPEVAVEVELPEGRFRIEKRWLSRPQARVGDAAGRLIAQADEAEAWIDRLIGGGLAGPSGLLWVRQGQMGLEPEDRRDRERDLSTRRDLLSSVAGEIDMMTGGRRMDAVIDRVAEALAALATPTGRPKAGGEWARAVEEAETLAAEEARLSPKAAALSEDLARRALVQKALVRLTDPADSAARAEALRQAQAAHEAARAHYERLVQAETTLRLARLDEEKLRAEIAAAEVLSARVAQARAALVAAEEQAATARSRAQELNARDRAAAEAAERLGAAGRTLRSRLHLAMQAEAARRAGTLAEELSRRLDRAAALQESLDRIAALKARLRITGAWMDAAETAQTAVDRARARAEAQAVTVEAQPDAAPALLDGHPLPAGPVPILKTAELTLPGFGRLRIDPGSGRGHDATAELAAAEQRLAGLLVEAQVADLAQARAQWQRLQGLEAEAAQARALLAELAPEGLEPLRTALLAAKSEAAAGPDEAEDVASLSAALTAAEAEEQTAQAAARAAHALAVEAGNALAGAEADRAAAARQVQSAQVEAGDEAALSARIADLRSREPALAAARAQAEAALEALRATAPDLAAAEARLTRAKGAVEQARSEEQKAREDLASLSARIAALAEEGIEERLSILADRRAAAEARAARYEAEVRALTRLRRALDEARTKARDAYFGPVLRELQPLLAMLHPGAEVMIDDQSLLPASLTRDGQAEPLEILSGGTREQVAILTRLAFARLFAASGRPVPVILDDALVHSDDDRIEAMFDALHRVARDQQILVLTCRQRAFAALGGERAEVRVETV